MERLEKRVTLSNSARHPVVNLCHKIQTMNLLPFRLKRFGKLAPLKNSGLQWKGQRSLDLLWQTRRRADPAKNPGQPFSSGRQAFIPYFSSFLGSSSAFFSPSSWAMRTINSLSFSDSAFWNSLIISSTFSLLGVGSVVFLLFGH